MEISKYQSKLGFSLIELLISLAIISIFTVNLVPNLNGVIAQERSAVLTNSLAGALAYARTESITKQKNVVTCQSNDGIECNESTNWHNGWIIFTDNNKNQLRDEDELLLRVYAPISNGTTATFRNYYLKYKPDGRAYPNGSFLICNPNIGVGKALIMSNTGRLRLSKKQTNGSAITCS